jgi:hypothetical protein
MTKRYRNLIGRITAPRTMEAALRLKTSIEEFSRETLGLRFSKWQIASVSRGINFLGYRIWASHKLLRKDSVTRARRKIAAYRAAGDHERLRKFLAAWLGHACWADSANLIRSLGVAIDAQRSGRAL